MRERKLNRKRNYDYSSDWYYFVTICTKNNIDFFWDIEDGKMILNNLWLIVYNEWNRLSKDFNNCFLDEYIIMPNHIHWIIIIDNWNSGSLRNGLGPFRTDVEFIKNGVGNGARSFRRKWLSDFIRSFKSFSSRKINHFVGKKIFAWHKSFHDSIIRDEKSLYFIRKYIKENPLKYSFDNC